jgi:hypothetical protein
MKLLFRLVTSIFGYSFVLNQYVVLYLEFTYLRREKHVFAENFIRFLVDNYGRHTVYNDRGTWYYEACKVIGLKHYLHSPFQKSLMDRVNQYFKDRIESFDDYYPCVKNDSLFLYV